MNKHALPSLIAVNGLKKLGEDVSAARKRRQFTQRRLAEGAGVSLPTIRRLESGDPGVSLATLAMVLVVLGEGRRLGQLLDASADDVGLMLEQQSLPKRVRSPRKKVASSGSPSGSESLPDDDAIGEAF